MFCRSRKSRRLQHWLRLLRFLRTDEHEASDGDSRNIAPTRLSFFAGSWIIWALKYSIRRRNRKVTQTATKQQPEAAPQPAMGEVSLPEVPLEDAREWQAERLRMLWGRRRLFFRAGAIGLLASTSVAFMIPKSYMSTAQLMPPDPQSTSGILMMAAMAAKAGGGLGPWRETCPGSRVRARCLSAF